MILVTMILGFLMLIVGANLLVEGSVKIAKKLKISTMIISMTIISIGTSMPEFAIACVSSLKGTQISLSNNIGSNISTIAISIGVTALIHSIHVKKSITNEVLRMILVQLVLLTLLILGGGLNLVDGFIFLIIFILYLRHLIKKAKSIVSEKDEEDLIEIEEKYIDNTENIIKNSVITLIVFIATGLIFVVYGGNFVVDSATEIAKKLNLSEAFIGVTIVALGTTLPELSTALVAAKKKEYDIILGNAVGSGVSNIMLIVGIAAVIHPIHYTHTLLFQIGFMLVFGLILYKLSSQQKIKKKDGFALLLTYICFVISSLLLM
ncbi:MAG: calcium/sodium antiporter [Clostridia bacterium]|nr:calcium/sodium antiporter [Clostridia bacterium]